MKTKINILLASFVLLLLQGWLPLHAQPLSLTLQMSPRPSPYLSDWQQRAESQLVISISNASTQSQSVYFTGSVTGDNGVSGQTKQGFKPVRGLVVPPNAVTSYTGPQLRGMFEWEQLNTQGVNVTAIERSGMLPEGNYTFCVEAKDFQTDQLLTTLQPSGCSPSFQITFPQPPFPTTPTCESTVQGGVQGQPILFAWTPAAGTPPRVQYRLRIVEIVGNRSANDALQSATTPPAFEKTVSGNTHLVNPIQIVTPQRRPGNLRFAWSVKVFDPAGKVSFSNNGESEACSFEYGSDGSITDGTVPDGPAVEIIIGRKSKHCTGFGICEIVIDTPKARDPGGIPDSRLDPRKPKVYASIHLTRDEGQLSVSISESDLRKYLPEKLKYFMGKSSFSQEEDYTASASVNKYLGAAKPIVINAGTYPMIYSGGVYTIFFDLKGVTMLTRPGEYGNREGDGCSPEGATITWRWHKTFRCKVDKMAAKECGEIKDKDKLVKKLEDFVKEHGKDWGKSLLSRAMTAVTVIKSVVTIYKTYDLYIHLVRPYADMDITYVCRGGKWVSTGGKVVATGEEDLGWFKLMIPHGDGSLCWTGNESVGELQEAVDAAAAGVCVAVSY